MTKMHWYNLRSMASIILKMQKRCLTCLRYGTNWRICTSMLFNKEEAWFPRSLWEMKMGTPTTSSYSQYMSFPSLSYSACTRSCGHRLILIKIRQNRHVSLKNITGVSNWRSTKWDKDIQICKRIKTVKKEKSGIDKRNYARNNATIAFHFFLLTI